MVPKIGVDVDIEKVGTAANGSMALPSGPQITGWWSPGVRPGEAGDAVIEGHKNWYTNEAHTACCINAVFYRLSELQVGDEMQIRRQDGTILKFKVVTAKDWAGNASAAEIKAAGLFQPSGPPQLTLYTCSGTWNGSQYTTRRVVTGVLST